MSLLVLGEILALFLNILTPDEKYHIEDCENLQLPIQMHLSEKRKICFKFLLHFWNIQQISNVLKEKMIVIANVFPKLQTVKILLRPLSKKRRFRTRIHSQDVKALKMLPISSWQRFYHVFSSFSGKLIWKMSPLVLVKILGSLLTHWQTMPSIPFKIMRICYAQFKCNYQKNQKLFLNFLFHFFNLHQVLKISKEKIIVLANVFPKLQTVKNFLEHSLKGAVSEHALRVNMWKRPIYLRNLHESPFIIFSHHSH